MSFSVADILILSCLFLCGYIVLVAVPSACGAILGLLFGAVIRAFRKEGGNPTVLSALVRAAAISVLLTLVAFFVEAARLREIPSGIGSVWIAAVALGFGLNVLLVLASVAHRPAPHGIMDAVHAGIAPCALLALLGFAIAVCLFVVLDQAADRGLDFMRPERLIDRLPYSWQEMGWFAFPMACSLIGGLVGFLVPFRRRRGAADDGLGGREDGRPAGPGAGRRCSQGPGCRSATDGDRRAG
jgi:hypothetical protein